VDLDGVRERSRLAQGWRGAEAVRKLIVFNSITLDGYFTDQHGDISWAHKSDPEWNAFVEENASSGGVLLFGRLTYELMASYWPTAAAKKQNPVVAERMNTLPKVVFSKTLKHVGWDNTRLVKDLLPEVRKLKSESGEQLVIFGSGTVVAQLAKEGLIDEFQLVLVPVVLGKGRTMFEGIKKKIAMKPTRMRRFENGNVLLCEEPATTRKMASAR
jgi:dihydrofolate reductase